MFSQICTVLIEAIMVEGACEGVGEKGVEGKRVCIWLATRKFFVSGVLQEPDMYALWGELWKEAWTGDLGGGSGPKSDCHRVLGGELLSAAVSA
jgi:hypothetical protein